MPQSLFPLSRSITPLLWPCLLSPPAFFKQRNLVVVALETQPGSGKGGYELRVPEADVKLVSTTELPPPYVPRKKPGKQKLQLTLDLETQLSGERQMRDPYGGGKEARQAEGVKHTCSLLILMVPRASGGYLPSLLLSTCHSSSWADIAKMSKITTTFISRPAKRPLQLPRRDLCSAGGDVGLQLLCNAAWSSPPIPISRYYQEEEDDDDDDNDDEEEEEMVQCYQKRGRDEAIGTPSPRHSSHGDSSADESWDRTSVESNSYLKPRSRPICRATTLNRYLPTTPPDDHHSVPKDGTAPRPAETVLPLAGKPYTVINHKGEGGGWLFLPPTCPY